MKNAILRNIMAEEGCTKTEAEEIFDDMKSEVQYEIQNDGDPEGVLSSYGLEPDYLLEFI